MRVAKRFGLPVHTAEELTLWLASRPPQNPKPDKGGCCGKLGNIIKGFGKLAWARISGGKPDPLVVARAEVCAACENRTFLGVIEWAINAPVSGDLPVNHTPGDWDALWCAKCKCCIEAKIRVESERCPLDKWLSAEALAQQAQASPPPTPAPTI